MKKQQKRCEVCGKPVHKKGKDWDFIDNNPKDVSLLNYNLALVLRVCNRCKDNS